MSLTALVSSIALITIIGLVVEIYGIKVDNVFGDALNSRAVQQ